MTGMVKSKITNEDPIGLHITQVLIDAQGDRHIIEYQQKANRAIKFYLDKPATAENCLYLIRYIDECIALCNNRPDSDAKTELVGLLTDVVDTLKTGVDRTEVLGYESKPKYNNQEGRFVTWEERLDKALARWEVWGWRNRKPVTDTKTLEGYMRYIHVERLTIYQVINKHFTDIRRKFFNTPDTDDMDVMLKFVDKATNRIIDKYALICLQTQAVKITTQVIADIYKEDDEFAEATFTVETQNAYATAQ